MYLHILFSPIISCNDSLACQSLKLHTAKIINLSIRHLPVLQHTGAIIIHFSLQLQNQHVGEWQKAMNKVIGRVWAIAFRHVKHCLALHGLHNIVCMFFYGIWFGYFPTDSMHCSIALHNLWTLPKYLCYWNNVSTKIFIMISSSMLIATSMNE